MCITKDSVCTWLLWPLDLHSLCRNAFLLLGFLVVGWPSCYKNKTSLKMSAWATGISLSFYKPHYLFTKVGKVKNMFNVFWPTIKVLGHIICNMHTQYLRVVVILLVFFIVYLCNFTNYQHIMIAKWSKFQTFRGLLLKIILDRGTSKSWSIYNLFNFFFKD